MSSNLPLRIIEILVLGGIVVAFIVPLFTYTEPESGSSVIMVEKVEYATFPTPQSTQEA